MVRRTGRRLISAWTRYSGSVGGPTTILWCLATGIQRVSRGRCRLVRYIVVAQPVPSQPLVSARRSRGIETRRLEPCDRALSAFPRAPEVYENRFAQGAVAYGAFSNGEPAGFIWFTLGAYEEDEVRCTFHAEPAATTAWDFDVYIAPRYRLTSVFARLWEAAGAHMRAAGVRWAVSRISAFNAHSIASHRRLGAVDCGIVNFLCIGSLQISIGSLSPRLRFSWCERDKPSFRVTVWCPRS